MNRKFSVFVSSPLLRTLLFLGFLEFGVAAFLILQVEPDQKNAAFLGYSFSRLILFLFTSALALWLLALTILPGYHEQISRRLDFIFQKQPIICGYVLLSLLFLSLIIFAVPFEFLEKYGLYFQRIRPLLFFSCLFPVQLSLNWIKNSQALNKNFLRLLFICLCTLLAIGGFLFFSGLGLTPEQDHWDIGGNPLTSLQLLVILLTGVLIFGFFRIVPFARKGKYLDVIIMLFLFALAVLFWQETKAPHNEFSTRPDPPYFQVFPESDAQIHDTGALAILNGGGIFFKRYTDKPLYMVFLALLHIFAGYDYNLLTFLHVSFFALMVPILYLLGISFHSRFFGFVLAGIVLVRQQNAILLSNVFNFNALPSQFMTEVPTLLGLIVSACVLFYWLRTPHLGEWRAFIAGGVLGAVSLIRLNPFLLIPTVPVYLFFVLHGYKKAWLSQSIFFMLGCALLILPWAVTGVDQSGRSFFLIKFQDVINVRYGPSSSLPSNLAGSLIPGTHSTSTQPAVSSMLLSAGPSILPINIHTFPGFVVNHTLHNWVTSFLTLPDSIQPNDQKLAVLVERSYWKLGKEEITLFQIPFILLNLCLLAIGFAWSWKRWKWAGLAPLFVFVVYSLSLGFARTSGSRYIVPIDWIIDFYYVLGVICLSQPLPQLLRQTLQVEPSDNVVSQAVNAKPSWMTIGAVVIIFCVASFIPAAQLLIPPREALCQSVDASTIKFIDGAKPDAFFVYGEILYPDAQKDHFAFTLLTCQKTFSFGVSGFQGRLEVGQRIIAALSGDSRHPHLQVIALPPDGNIPAKIIWMGESE
jgi:hypothetical protein